jgi:hypothetical protein
MHVETNGIAIFKLNETGEFIHVEGSELDWDNEGDGEEGPMGEQIVHSADLDIEGNSVTWKIYEYPAGVENYTPAEPEYNREALTLIQNFQYWLEHDAED